LDYIQRVVAEKGARFKTCSFKKRSFFGLRRMTPEMKKVLVVDSAGNTRVLCQSLFRQPNPASAVRS
jgi:hypothetical protein